MKQIFYDTDILSCFISIDDVSILEILFDEVIIPQEVYDEFSKLPVLKKRVDKLLKKKFIRIEKIIHGSQEHRLYASLRYGYEFDRRIGGGEAAAIALAVKHNGILASNKTRDIAEAIKKFNIKRIKTGDIFVKAYNEGFISKEYGDELWAKMILKKRFLTEDTFSDYLEKNPKSIF